MNYLRFDILGPVLFQPEIHEDSRGYFMESFRHNLFQDATCITENFAQDNESLTMAVNTVRGLHFQGPPSAQGKLIRCTQGAISDFIVDIRRGSPNYGQHLRVELSADNRQQLWVPPGFLHCLITRALNTVAMYKMTNVYDLDHDGNIDAFDPDIGIAWGVPRSTIHRSNRDTKGPAFADFMSPFEFRD